MKLSVQITTPLYRCIDFHTNINDTNKYNNSGNLLGKYTILFLIDFVNFFKISFTAVYHFKISRMTFEYRYPAVYNNTLPR